MHQLIVLGNGFDRACGLNSGFDQFYSTRYGDNGERLIPLDEETAWDVILGSTARNSPLWCDVESLIAKWVVGNDGKARLVHALDIRGSSIAGTSGRADLLRELRELLKSPCPEEEVYQCGASWELQEANETFSFLLSELRLFEGAFTRYLQDDVYRTIAYPSNAAMMLERLVGDGWGRSASSDLTSVINFNYTTFQPIGVGTVVHNVHGSLRENNIVMGIDGKGVEDDSPALPFTKTYRLLELDRIEHGSLVHPAYSDNPTTIIKFFGHSLAEADYSYFQAVFDAVDLYGSDVVLGFYYLSYRDENGKVISDRDIRKRHYHMVSHLLMTYGKTLENASHGANLMHKLLLEGRLYIKSMTEI